MFIQLQTYDKWSNIENGVNNFNLTTFIYGGGGGNSTEH